MKRKFNIGQEIVCITNLGHYLNPRYFPPINTKGIINQSEEDGYWVQWEIRSTSGDDRWHIPKCAIAKQGG